MLLTLPAFAFGSDFSGLISDRFIDDLLIGIMSVLLSILTVAGLRRIKRMKPLSWLFLLLFPVLVIGYFQLIYLLAHNA